MIKYILTNILSLIFVGNIFCSVNNLKSEKVVEYYKKAGTDKLRNINVKRVSEWLIYCEKWKFLAGKEEKINMVNCMIATIHHETDGRWWFIKNEDDGTKSYGITQLNTKVIFYIEEILDKEYPEFRNRDIRIDAEKNIAGRFLWIKHRREVNKGWAYLSDERGWILYSILQGVK